MTTYAILTVGYNEFLMPATEAQKCFEAMSGRAIDVTYITSDDATLAGTTRGDALRNAETRVSCRLMTVDAMHEGLDRGRACDAHAKAQRETTAA
jgi:hypothetical protein